MIPLGLHGRELQTLIRAMWNDHRQRVLVHSLNLDGDYDADLTPMLLDGQVNVDDTADVTRSASLTLLDPNSSLDFDSDSPGEAALFLDRMIKIWYGVLVDLGDGLDWVDIPVFTGPITSLSRSGDTVDVECQGKEVLALGVAWKALTIPKGTPKVTCIRIILRDRTGEHNFSLPNLPPRLPKAITLGRTGVPWLRCKQFARALGARQLFYDGRGTVRLRQLPQKPVITIDANAMLSELEVSYTQDEVHNAVWVKGGVPEGLAKGQITAEVFAARRHPLSPVRLGRNGVPRYLMEEVEDDSLRTVKAAVNVGHAHLTKGLQQSVEASFDVMPLPMLEPGDVVRAVTDRGSVTFALHQFSIPLTVGQPMSLGYLRNVSPQRRHGRVGRPWRISAATRHEPAALRKARQQARREAAKKTTAKAVRARRHTHHASR